MNCSLVNCAVATAAARRWVAPSLVDGRWRYGGRDEAISVDLLRATEGDAGVRRVTGAEIVWAVVANFKSQAAPLVVPTTRGSPGEANAGGRNRRCLGLPGPASEEKAFPSEPSSEGPQPQPERALEEN